MRGNKMRWRKKERHKVKEGTVQKKSKDKLTVPDMT